MKHVFRLIFCVGFGIALWLSLVHIPPTIPGIASDPVKHAVGWAVLTLLLSLAFPRLSTLKLITLLASANLVTEALQGLALSGRDPNVLDWTWGTLGIVIIAGLRHITVLGRVDDLE